MPLGDYRQGILFRAGRRTQWRSENVLNGLAGRVIAPNTGANATPFFHFSDQILKISRQIGD